VSISGRFSAKRGDQGGTGQFRFVTDSRSVTLELFTPTGAQLARIERAADARKVVGMFGDGSVRDAENFSELLRAFIDIPINDAQFFSWLQGIPSDRQTRVVHGNDGRIESFLEAGWTIVVNARFEADANLVRRMRWSFDAGGDSARDAQVTWVFDEFSIP
jgi:outer membrane biogenesis lipoprotein LolB